MNYVMTVFDILETLPSRIISIRNILYIFYSINQQYINYFHCEIEKDF